MAKNDYRRSLIMLRAHENGYSGHVRLEHRIMMGSMYFTVSTKSAPPTLCALLVRSDARGGYAAAKLGELRWDGRGQSTLAHSFDPRNIAGRPLDDYILIVIAAVSANGCAVALTGNVNGSRNFRYDGVRDAVCAACVQGRKSGGERDESDSEDAPNAEARLNESEDVPNTEAHLNESEDTSIAESPSLSGSCASCAAELESPADDLPDAEDGETAETPESPQDQASADSELQIAASTPWSGAAENVRALFLNAEPAVLMLGDGYVYVRAPMPEDSGFPFVNVGVRLENGAPVGIAYAFPASISAFPPEGMEDYVWRGGAADGWWVLYTNPETGEDLALGE